VNSDPYAQAVVSFYRNHLVNTNVARSVLTADCPFCPEKGLDGGSKLIVTVNPEGFFHGYFRCLNRCVPGGFPLWFGALAQIEPAEVPGFDPDREYFLAQTDYPGQAINTEVRQYQDNLTKEIRAHFARAGVSAGALRELGIGYNGRYLVYPYIQEDGNCYTARCVFPGQPEDEFWHGDERLVADEFQLFNVEDIRRCENGTLILCEGEDNLLTLKQIGLPGVALPYGRLFDTLEAERFAFIKTLFIAAYHNAESESRVRSFASRVGFKVRLLRWASSQERNYSLWQLACDSGADFGSRVIGMARKSKPFSPFASPMREHDRFLEVLGQQASAAYDNLKTGFALLDDAIDGIHGLNVVGGAPKVGKSCFMIQVATELARRSVPVIYYDFENGRQKIYQRTMARLSRVTIEALRRQSFDEPGKVRVAAAQAEFKKMLHWFRVVNDRKVTPEIMRRHVDFIRHETGRDFTVIVIDSLHKLPFKDFSERRTGIDAWLRHFESIRDEMQVSFLIISELSRGDQGSYQETPHMGVFKGSGDIEYSADNAMVIYPQWDHEDAEKSARRNNLWLVASREHSPGLVATYRLDYPYWGFTELEPASQ
jgi:replicative DNA helicase